MNVSMWCNGCQEWTTSYSPSGIHTCGTEVDSAGFGKVPGELAYEGKALEE